jgi:hypothetical protein
MRFKIRYFRAVRECLESVRSIVVQAAKEQRTQLLQFCDNFAGSNIRLFPRGQRCNKLACRGKTLLHLDGRSSCRLHGTPAVTSGIAAAPDLSEKSLSLLREKVSDPKLAFEKP